MYKPVTYSYTIIIKHDILCIMGVLPFHTTGSALGLLITTSPEMVALIDRDFSSQLKSYETTVIDQSITG